MKQTFCPSTEPEAIQRILAHLFTVANDKRNAALTAAGFDADQVPIETPEVVAATEELAAVCRTLDGACEDCLCYPCVCPF